MARLRRFRLGADGSPAPSAQALQPDQADAPHSAGEPETRRTSRRRGRAWKAIPAGGRTPRAAKISGGLSACRGWRVPLLRYARSPCRHRDFRQPPRCQSAAFPRDPFSPARVDITGTRLPIRIIEIVPDFQEIVHRSPPRAALRTKNFRRTGPLIGRRLRLRLRLRLGLLWNASAELVTPVSLAAQPGAGFVVDA